MKNVKIYEVGGSIRDSLLGLRSKDRDFCVIAPSYEVMKNHIIEQGGEIFLEKPEYFTIRCKLEPYGASDFVLGRKEGYYNDGRRPSEVTVVDTIEEELSRRDFTVNAMARDEEGSLIDPFGGEKDLLYFNVIRCVGKAKERFTEDSLRMLRAIRFAITKQMILDKEIEKCLQDPEMVNLLKNVSVERVREELFKCFHHDTELTLQMWEKFPLIQDYVFEHTNLWLKPTLEK